MRRIAGVLAGLVLLFGASPALAHHIAGKVMCDVDLDGTFSAADTPLSGIEVDITSQDVSPGRLFTGTTDGTGSYNVPLPARTLTLAAGTFTFCDLKMGRNAVLTTLGVATLNVHGSVVIGTASTFGPAARHANRGERRRQAGSRQPVSGGQRGILRPVRLHHLRARLPPPRLLLHGPGE